MSQQRVEIVKQTFTKAYKAIWETRLGNFPSVYTWLEANQPALLAEIEASEQAVDAEALRYQNDQTPDNKDFIAAGRAWKNLWMKAAELLPGGGVVAPPPDAQPAATASP